MTDYTATETREQLDQIRENTTAGPPEFNETLDETMRQIVEGGKMTPDESVKAKLSLTRWERVTGVRYQDVTAVFSLGVILGAALERDIPEDSELEDAWRDGGFELPKDDS